MIIGVVSSTQSHIQLIKDTIATKYDFIHVTEENVVSAVGIGRLVNGDKRPLLDSLQRTYGNVLISGDALWSETLCQYLLGNLGGALLIDINLPKPDELPHGQYWGYEGIIDWVVQVQSKRVPLHEFKRMTPNDGTIVYLDTDNSQFQSNMVALMETIQNHYEKRDVVNVSMEDVIKQAMADLGIEPPPAQVTIVDSSNKPIPISQTEKITLPEVKETVELAAQHPIALSADQYPTIVSKGKVAPEEEQNLNTSSITDDTLVYLKMKDGTMALFVPTNIQLPTQVISGVEYHTLVFTAPDLGNTGLQPLKVQNVVVSTKVERHPISTPVVSSQLAVGSSNLQQLVAQKVQLDQSIKEARAANDEARVTELRKQRRLIRRQINKWGVEAHATT